MPIRLNGEVTVDWDGTVYGGNAFLHETEHKQKFVTGHLDDLRNLAATGWMDPATTTCSTGPTRRHLPRTTSRSAVSSAASTSGWPPTRSD